MHEPLFPPSHPSPARGEGDLDERHIARLRWRCRRGLLELDLVLLRFLEQTYSTLNAAEQQIFQELLALPDQTLLAYLNASQTPPNPELKNIVAKIQ